MSRGCSRGEESCSLYLVDPIAISEVRGEEVLASTLDGDRLWRWVPGVPGVPSYAERMDWDLYGDVSIYALLLLHRKVEPLPCHFSYPLEIGHLKLHTV